MGDVVLEETLSTIVGETLGQLDNGDEESRGGQILANAAKRALLLVIGLLAIGRGAVFSVKVLLLDGDDVGVVAVVAGELATSHVGVVLAGGALVERLVEPARRTVSIEVRCGDAS